MKYFCGALHITEICEYKQYVPKVCCCHCDKREDCFLDQITIEEVTTMPCVTLSPEDFQKTCEECEYSF